MCSIIKIELVEVVGSAATCVLINYCLNSKVSKIKSRQSVDLLCIKYKFKRDSLVVKRKYVANNNLNYKLRDCFCDSLKLLLKNKLGNRNLRRVLRKIHFKSVSYQVYLANRFILKTLQLKLRLNIEKNTKLEAFSEEIDKGNRKSIVVFSVEGETFSHSFNNSSRNDDETYNEFKERVVCVKEYALSKFVGSKNKK